MATDSAVIAGIRNYIRTNRLNYDYVSTELDMANLVEVVLLYAPRSTTWYEQQRDQILKLHFVPKLRKRYA